MSSRETAGGRSCFRLGRRCALVDDRELREFPGVATPANVDGVDSRRGGAVVRPAGKLLDRVLFALGAELDTAVRTVANPSGEPEPLRLTLRCSAKVDSLNTPADDELDTLLGHGDVCCRNRSFHRLPKDDDQGNLV